MMKQLLVAITLLAWAKAPAQQTTPTDQLFITGRVKKERTFTLANLVQWPATELGDVNTSCSSKKSVISKGVKGILLRQLIDSVAFEYTNSHQLNSFYFRMEAADGYTVVYSFGEIYNTETGRHLYLVTGKDGKPATETDNRILLLTTTDLKPGSRNMKWLKKIVVCRAE